MDGGAEFGATRGSPLFLRGIWFSVTRPDFTRPPFNVSPRRPRRNDHTPSHPDSGRYGTPVPAASDVSPDPRLRRDTIRRLAGSAESANDTRGTGTGCRADRGGADSDSCQRSDRCGRPRRRSSGPGGLAKLAPGCVGATACDQFETAARYRRAGSARNPTGVSSDRRRGR